VNEREALTAVARMYAGHGSTKPPEVVAELAGEAIAAACSSCAKEVLESARKGPKPLTVRDFLEQYRRSVGSPDHLPHVGQDDRQVDVGRLEAAWRRDGVARLVAAGMEHDRAEVAAAMAWASEVVDPDTFELDVTAWARHTPANITAEVIAAAWSYARAIATHPPVEMSEAEWQRVVGPWAAAWRAAA
jgi:hypothetical protein